MSEPPESTALTVVPENRLAPLSPLMESALLYAGNAKAKSTVTAYANDWADFTAFCAANNLEALPARQETVACYITHLANHGPWLDPKCGQRRGACKVSTIIRRLAAISKWHQGAGHESPCSMRHALVKEVCDGIRRVKGMAQRGMDPLLTDDVRRLLATVDNNETGRELTGKRARAFLLIGKRDRALLLIGFAGGFRRSEIVALNVEDVDESNKDGLKITLRRSKTDQEGRGRSVGIPYGSSEQRCPVRSLKDWQTTAGITSGPIFRGIDRYGNVSPRQLTAQCVLNIVKTRCRAAGLDPTRFAAHSLRSGFVTQASINDATERSIMNQTGHRSVQMVRRYIREGNLFRDNAATRLGL